MKCEHQGCRCEDTRVQRGNKKFCSERCADMELSGRHEPYCLCGHAECAAG